MAKIIFKHQAYQALKKKLINCEYKPGSCLREAELVEELGFSRTPIREALVLIEQEGFIHIMPKKGILVTSITLNDVKQIFQLRKVIEPIALCMAAPNLPQDKLLKFHHNFSGEPADIHSAFHLDTAMHLFIIEYCGNRYIIQMMRKVFEENTRIIISSEQNVKIHDSRAEHLEVLNLLMEGNIEQAAESMKVHIHNCEQHAIDFFYNSVSSPDVKWFMYQESLAQYAGTFM